MIHQMMMRPMDIYRTGVTEPYPVEGESLVTMARNVIPRYVQAIRPEGSLIHPTALSAPPVQIVGNEGFGIVSPEVLRTLSPSGIAGFGQEETEAEKYKTQRWYFAAGSVALGLATGFVLGKWVF